MNLQIIASFQTGEEDSDTALPHILGGLELEDSVDLDMMSAMTAVYAWQLLRKEQETRYLHELIRNPEGAQVGAYAERLREVGFNIQVEDC